MRGAPVAGQGRPDFLGLGHRGHQRFVAVDVLLVGDGREQGLLVEMIGRGDVDDVDLGVLSDDAVVGGRYVGANRLSGLFGGLRPAGYDMGDPGCKRHRVVEQWQVQVAVGMDLADEAESQDADAVNLQENLPLTHVPAAIDVDRLASDIAVGGQHHHHVGHLIHSAESAHGDQVSPLPGDCS